MTSLLLVRALLYGTRGYGSGNNSAGKLGLPTTNHGDLDISSHGYVLLM
jgi:hypothetical protein